MHIAIFREVKSLMEKKDIEELNLLLESLLVTYNNDLSEIIIKADKYETEERIREILSKETCIDKNLVGAYYKENPDLLNENYIYKIYYATDKTSQKIRIKSIESKYAVFAAILIDPLSIGVVTKASMPIIRKNQKGEEELIKYISGENVPMKFLLETDNTVNNEKLNFIMKDRNSLTSKLKMLLVSTVSKIENEV